MDDEYESEFEYDEIEVEQDIVGVCNALKASWRLLPTTTLANLLDIALPSTLGEMSDQEIIESLQEFIHQNQ